MQGFGSVTAVIMIYIYNSVLCWQQCRTLLAACFNAGNLLRSILDPEDGDDIFFGSVGLLSSRHQVNVYIYRLSTHLKQTAARASLITVVL
jgi:hypothetical protein